MGHFFGQGALCFSETSTEANAFCAAERWVTLHFRSCELQQRLWGVVQDEKSAQTLDKPHSQTRCEVRGQPALMFFKHGDLGIWKVNMREKKKKKKPWETTWWYKLEQEQRLIYQHSHHGSCEGIVMFLKPRDFSGSSWCTSGMAACSTCTGSSQAFIGHDLLT